MWMIHWWPAARPEIRAPYDNDVMPTISISSVKTTQNCFQRCHCDRADIRTSCVWLARQRAVNYATNLSDTKLKSACPFFSSLHFWQSQECFNLQPILFLSLNGSECVYVLCLVWLYSNREKKKMSQWCQHTTLRALLKSSMFLITSNSNI